MPKPAFQANGEAMPIVKLDRASIMKAAHRYARTYQGRQWSYSFLLKNGLKAAWREAKEGLTPAQRRAETIRDEIDALQFKSFRYDISVTRRVLEAELSALAA